MKKQRRENKLHNMATGSGASWVFFIPETYSSCPLPSLDRSYLYLRLGAHPPESPQGSLEAAVDLLVLEFVSKAIKAVLHLSQASFRERKQSEAVGQVMVLTLGPAAERGDKGLVFRFSSGKHVADPGISNEQIRRALDLKHRQAPCSKRHTCRGTWQHDCGQYQSSGEAGRREQSCVHGGSGALGHHNGLPGVIVLFRPHFVPGLA